MAKIAYRRRVGVSAAAARTRSLPNRRAPKFPCEVLSAREPKKISAWSGHEALPCKEK
jgi:hypothetical protein